MQSPPPLAAAWRSGTTLPADAVIAIDGPAGSGKSTTAKSIAQHYGLLYIDSGAMYRALTLAALREGVDAGDGERLGSLLAVAQLELRSDRRETTVLWQGRDVSTAIRSPEVDSSVSRISSHPAVRRGMVARQRALARQGGVVMEGRDIGSVVFPLATSKIFLDASLDARVERRFRQFRQRGEEVDSARVRADLAARDQQDSQRSDSPLTISPDAVVLDTSDWNLATQVKQAQAACLVNPYLDAQLDTDWDTAWRDCLPKYRFAYRFFRLLAHFFGLRQVGLRGQAVPTGVILACNHVHWYDPPLVGSAFGRCPMHTLAKEELFVGPLRLFFRWIDTIPIRRKGYDPDAFREAREALAAGHNVFIFPEGTRRPVGHPGPIKQGLGILAQESVAPLMPFFIRGTWGLQPGGSQNSPLELRCGPVVRLHALPILKQRYDRREISQRIADLCLACFKELQAQSYAETPETDFERELAERMESKLAEKTRQVFGQKPAQGDSPPAN